MTAASTRHRRRAPALALGLAATQALSGCTLIGAGIGATVDATSPPRYEETELDHYRLHAGQTLILTLTDGREIKGNYRGFVPVTRNDPRAYVAVVTEDGKFAYVPVDEIQSVRAKLPKNGWAIGGGIGLAVDVTVVITAAIVGFSMAGKQY